MKVLKLVPSRKRSAIGNAAISIADNAIARDVIDLAIQTQYYRRNACH